MFCDACNVKLRVERVTGWTSVLPSGSHAKTATPFGNAPEAIWTVTTRGRPGVMASPPRGDLISKRPDDCARAGLVGLINAKVQRKTRQNRAYMFIVSVLMSEYFKAGRSLTWSRMCARHIDYATCCRPSIHVRGASHKERRACFDWPQA